jgi:hypothetical protein
MKTAPRVAATVAAAAAVSIGLASPAAATTHAKPGPSPSVSSNLRTINPGRPGGNLFERIEKAIEKLLDRDQEPP